MFFLSPLSPLLQVWNSAPPPSWTGNSAPSLLEVGSRQQCSLPLPVLPDLQEERECCSRPPGGWGAALFRINSSQFLF